MDKGEVLVPEVVVELHWVIDLALHDTKHTASAIRYLMAAMIVMERLNQWLNQIPYHNQGASGFHQLLLATGAKGGCGCLSTPLTKIGRLGRTLMGSHIWGRAIIVVSHLLKGSQKQDHPAGGSGHHLAPHPV